MCLQVLYPFSHGLRLYILDLLYFEERVCDNRKNEAAFYCIKTTAAWSIYCKDYWFCWMFKLLWYIDADTNFAYILGASEKRASRPWWDSQWTCGAFFSGQPSRPLFISSGSSLILLLLFLLCYLFSFLIITSSLQVV